MPYLKFIVFLSVFMGVVVVPANSDDGDKCQKNLTEANREAWNQVAPLHEAAGWEMRVNNFRQPGFSDLNELETEYLNQIGLRGLRVAHPCCNSGEELLSMVNLGATGCTGFDFSDAFIRQAQDLAKAANISCEFVSSDIYEIPARYDGLYDLVYISVGTLGWMPDLPKFFQRVTALLKTGGRIFIYESHPVLDMYSTDEEQGLNPVYSYFRTEPIIETQGLDYVGGTDYVSKPKYWFHHKMSDVIQSLVNLGFNIETFRELDHDRSMDFQHFNNQAIKPPMSYLLIGRLRN